MKISKWLQIGLVILILSSVLLAGCVSKSDYEALQAEHVTVVQENTRLKENLQSVQSDLTKLQADYNKKH